MSENRLVVVLGMHRSGTSAIARGLKVLAADLGDRLLPGIRGNNDKGFWEDSDINAFNVELLEKLDSGWDRLTPIEDSRLLDAGLAKERERAAALLREKFRPAAIFAFKDPRTAVLLPFWKPVFAMLGVSARYVVAVRHPVEVAQSLAKRNGFSPTRSFLLWLRYNLSALSNTEGEKRVFVAYAAMLADPLGQLRRISRALDLPDPESDQQALTEYARDFLSAGLRHHTVSSEVSAELREMPSHVAEMAELLAAMTAGRSDETMPMTQESLARWHALRGRYADLKPLLMELDRSYADVSYQSVKSEVRVYFSERVDGAAQSYSGSRALFGMYALDGATNTVTLDFPDDLQPLVSLRLDIANAPATVILHALSLHQADGEEIWRWAGGGETFVKPLGLVCWPLRDGLALFCLNNDPQCELAIPPEQLARLRGGASLRLELTPRPALDGLSAVQAEMQKKLQTQQRELGSLQARQQSLHQQMVRAEAQLELLKEMLLPGEDGLERL